MNRSAPQPAAGVTYAAKIDKREARIDWTEPAETIERKVRAFNPVPGATTAHRGIPLKVWRAAVVANVEGDPGAVLQANRSGITVAAGVDALKITELQRAGGKRVPVASFLAGYAIQPGERLSGE